VGFLVAFFFIVLFSLGLDLVAAVPGFFIAAIRVPPLGSLLPDKHQNWLIWPTQLLRIIEICYVRIKRLTAKFRKKF
jgi:hypothetical protein